MHGEHPRDYRHGEDGTLTTELGPFTYAYGGFPCTDVSSLNNLRGGFRDVVAARGGTTGKVFGFMKDIIANQTMRPPDGADGPFIGGIMENVLGLAVGKKEGKGIAD